MPARPSPAAAKRPRDAAATKAAILRAALVAFTRAGYDGVGVREIAAEAGVTAMLVNRYFGSKEALFAAAAEAALADAGNLLHHAATLSRTVAHRIAADPGAGAVDPLLLTLRSAANPRAAAILRDGLARHVERPLAAALPGPDADGRAGLVLALALGVQVLRGVLGSAALAACDAEAMRDRIAAVLRLLSEPVAQARDAT